MRWPPETLTLLTFKARDGSVRKREVFVGPVGGYAASMSDAETPTPPGSPMRRDEPNLSEEPGGHDDEVSGSRAANRNASEAGGGTIPVDAEPPGPDGEPGDDHGLQEENAETSQDQPSQ